MCLKSRTFCWTDFKPERFCLKIQKKISRRSSEEWSSSSKAAQLAPETSLLFKPKSLTFLYRTVSFNLSLSLTRFISLCAVLNVKVFLMVAVTLIICLFIHPAGGTALPSLCRRKTWLFCLTARSKWRDRFLGVTSPWWTTRASLFLGLVCWITRFSRSDVIDDVMWEHLNFCLLICTKKTKGCWKGSACIPAVLEFWLQWVWMQWVEVL